VVGGADAGPAWVQARGQIRLAGGSCVTAASTRSVGLKGLRDGQGPS
jgi:hypothetical protein